MPISLAIATLRAAQGVLIPNPTFHDLVGYLLAGMNLLALGIIGWFTYVIRGLTKDIGILADQIKEVKADVVDKIKERNVLFDRVHTEIKAHEDSILSLADRINTCNLNHMKAAQDYLQRVSKAELRSEDLKRIDEKLELLFDLNTRSAVQLSDVRERLVRVETRVEAIHKNGHGGS